MDEASSVTSNRILSTNRKQLDHPHRVSQEKPPITYTRVAKVLTNNKGNQKQLKVESPEKEEYPANVEPLENAVPQKTEVEVDQVLDEIRNTCPFCEKRFINPERVEVHVAYVHRRQYQCDLCKKAYHTAEELDEHKVIHRSDYFFECNVCRVKYKSSGSLRRHQIRNHSAYEPKYVCEHCGRNYKLKIDLTQHIKRTHDSELRVCRFCGKEVKDVKTHEWRHMKRNGEMKYKYTCHLCRKKFLHQSRLDTHLRLHERGFKCEDCNKEFRGTRELANHRQFNHGQAKIYNCTLCQRNFNQSGNFHQHVLTHAGIRPYRCDICEEDFTQRSSLLRHRRQHPGPLPPMHSKHTHIADLARNYLQKLQTDQVDRNNVLNTKLYNALDPLAPTFLIVKLEDNYFRIPTSLSVYMMKEPAPGEEANTTVTSKADTASRSSTSQSAENVKDNAIDDQFDDLDDAPLDFRKKQVEEKFKTEKLKKKVHTCEICYASFDRKSKHTRHMYKHSNSRPHKCEICSKGFKTSAHLARHMEIHYEPVTWHKCNLCDFKARTKPYLKIHYIRKHTEDYNYKCEQCGKMFKVQSDYTTHVKDHDTESCVCDICGSSYPSKSSLYFHKYYKHKTKVKKFQCQTCNKKFKTQKNLESHTELHKIKYVCEQCGMEFKTKYGLTKHLRTHSGEKSYLCAICGKTFGCLSSQKIHLLTHVGERPYICDICGQSFTQRSPMMLHRRKHPGIHPPPPPIKITNLLHGVQDKIIVNKSSK